MRETILTCARAWRLALLLVALAMAELTIAMLFHDYAPHRSGLYHWCTHVLPHVLLGIVQRALAVGLVTAILLERKTLRDAWAVTRKRWLHLTVLGFIVGAPTLLADALRSGLMGYGRALHPGLLLYATLPASLLSWALSVRLLLAPALMLQSHYSFRGVMLASSVLVRRAQWPVFFSTFVFVLPPLYTNWARAHTHESVHWLALIVMPALVEALRLPYTALPSVAWEQFRALPHARD